MPSLTLLAEILINIPLGSWHTFDIKKLLTNEFLLTERPHTVEQPAPPVHPTNVCQVYDLLLFNWQVWWHISLFVKLMTDFYFYHCLKRQDPTKGPRIHYSCNQILSFASTVVSPSFCYFFVFPSFCAWNEFLLLFFSFSFSFSHILLLFSSLYLVLSSSHQILPVSF
jgi:hypothetical protein